MTTKRVIVCDENGTVHLQKSGVFVMLCYTANCKIKLSNLLLEILHIFRKVGLRVEGKVRY